MRLGFHISIAGGFTKAAQRAVRLGCETLQVFSHNPRSWICKDLSREDLAGFHALVKDAGISPVAVHMPYLPNLASPDDALYEKSVGFLTLNLSRARALKADFLVVHPGSSGPLSEAEAARKIAEAVKLAFKQSRARVTLLIENTAGQGSEFGFNFSQLQRIISEASGDKRIGVCLDTAHLYAAGYDLACRKGLEDTLKAFDRNVGLSRLRLLHLNDSRGGLGSHSDRHWHIGRGAIGREGFRRLLNHPALKDLPAVMETPQKSEGDERMNLKAARNLTRR